MMNRSFDRRLESLFRISDQNLLKLTVGILNFNLLDNTNSYYMTEDGSYVKYQLEEGEPEINIHKLFFKLHEDDLKVSSLF